MTWAPLPVIVLSTSILFATWGQHSLTHIVDEKVMISVHVYRALLTIIAIINVIIQASSHSSSFPLVPVMEDNITVQLL